MRAFSEDEVLPSVLEQILHAGSLAPSPKNRQPWHFVVSLRNERRDELTTRMKAAIASALDKEPHRADLSMATESVAILAHAPVVIFICYRPNTAILHDDGVNWKLAATDLEAVELQSVGAAAENMLLKAEELGLGGLWCGDVLYAYRELMACLKTDYPMVSAICLGYPAEQPASSSRHSLSQCCTFL